MKKLNKLFALSLSAVTLLTCVGGCGNEKSVEYDKSTRAPEDKGEQTYTLNASDYEQYFNHIDFKDGDGEHYEIGDPFIFRYDGKYYLYSSLNGEKRFDGKIPCWESENLVDWQWSAWAYSPKRINGELDDGGITSIACAPEVVYYQGWFYLCESDTGDGHYFFRSKNPNGPFERISDNLGGKIDGGFYLHDDGQLYFTTALLSGIAYAPVYIMETASSVTLTVGEYTALPTATLSNMWTEGPAWFKRNGYSYLTYTGNHVDSASYRVGYAYTESDFVYEDLKTYYNNVTLVSNGEDTDPIYIGYNGDLITSEDKFSNYRGTGHSCNTVGPNLDSIYTGYHTARRINYNNVQEGSTRKFNLTRYYTNGGYVLSDSLANFNVTKPQMPDYASKASSLVSVGNAALSTQTTGEVYTAELNFKTPNNKAELYASHAGVSNYVKINVTAEKLSVVKVTNGVTKVVGSADIRLGTNPDAVHTVKVVNGKNASEIYFDNMLKISYGAGLGGGRIGYGEHGVGTNLCFTKDAFGTSDFDAVKNLTGSFPAYSYVKGENKGWSIKNAKMNSNGMRQSERETTVKTADGYATVLQAGDWVKYNVNAPEQGYYDLTALVSADSQGAIIEAVVDNEMVYRLDVDKTDFGGKDYMETSLGQFFVDEGYHTLKIRVFSGNFKVKQFKTEKNADPIGEVSETLTTKPADVKTLIGHSYYTANGMVTNEFIERTMTYWGQRGMSDYEFSATLSLPASTLVYGKYDGGFLFRAKNYHYSANAKVPANIYGWQGYFLRVTNTGLSLLKCNFSSKILGNYDLEEGTFFNMGKTSIDLKIRCYHSEIDIFVNTGSGYKKVISVVDSEQPFTTGYIGFYTVGDQALYKNFNYREI